MLVVSTDNKLSFDGHIINICKTMNKKLNALSRTNHYLKQKARRNIIVFLHNLSFQLLSPHLNVVLQKSTKKITAVHERTLRIILNDCESPYSLSLEEAHQITFYQQCINSLIIVVYKYLNGHLPGIMNDIFKSKKCVRSAKLSHLPDRNPCSLKYGVDAIPCGVSQLWHQVVIDIREAHSLVLFKIALRFGNVKIVYIFMSMSISHFIENVRYISLRPINN